MSPTGPQCFKVRPSRKFNHPLPFSQGNEGVEVKEGSVANIIENNYIFMQKDPESGGAAFVVGCMRRISRCGEVEVYLTACTI